MDFSLEIAGLPQLLAQLQNYPAVSAPILQRAVVASSLILAKNTTARTVPVRTGFLLQSFGSVISPLTAIWGPDRAYRTSYSRFVEFGTKPHVIVPKDKKALYWPGAAHPVRRVNHPGSRANPYMERILDVSTEEIQETFAKALDEITAQIAHAS